VKLDRALVTDAIGNKKKSTLLKAVAEICKVYEYKLVAEGIETKKDFEFLKKLGYDWLQGYYFSRPVPSEEYTKLLTQEK
jgi:EAL domain-containing protein (putative c-di-GMP-specific phosphodiesterase class I)